MRKSLCPSHLSGKLEVRLLDLGNVLDVERILKFRGASTTFNSAFCLRHPQDYFRGYWGMCLSNVFLSSLAKEQFGGLVSPSSEARRDCIHKPTGERERVEVPGIRDLES